VKGTILFLFFFITVISQHCNGVDVSNENSTGALIVTYSTDDMKSRLDRIHFWLIDEDHAKTLYPLKSQISTNHPINNQETVVIQDLAPGSYTVKFLLPNADRFFEEIPSRQVIIEAGER